MVITSPWFTGAGAAAVVEVEVDGVLELASSVELQPAIRSGNAAATLRSATDRRFERCIIPYVYSPDGRSGRSASPRVSVGGLPGRREAGRTALSRGW